LRHGALGTATAATIGRDQHLGLNNFNERPSLKYKRAFFVDWRTADRHKKTLLDRIDYVLDTNERKQPVMIPRSEFRRALDTAASRPFRLVPFFDPGPWGGQWMKEVCKLPQDVPNFAWCFDCVPEENSLLLGFGATNVEIPAIDLVFQHPRRLLGDAVHARFGTEFPSALTSRHHGRRESFIPGASAYRVHTRSFWDALHAGRELLPARRGQRWLCLSGIEGRHRRERMIADLRAAQEDDTQFDAHKYVNKWPAKKHDHFLIPREPALLRQELPRVGDQRYTVHFHFQDVGLGTLRARWTASPDSR